MREPDFSGIGRAWEMQMGNHHRTEQEATLKGYVVNGPWHPFWSWWMVAVIHLREIPGTRPPHKHYPEAEYEFMIVSIDPETVPDPDQPFPQDIRYLSPPDVVKQFHGVTDEQAAEICESAAHNIAMGASPDSDNRRWWEGSIERTVEHYRQGIH